VPLRTWSPGDDGRRPRAVPEWALSDQLGIARAAPGVDGEDVDLVLPGVWQEAAGPEEDAEGVLSQNVMNAAGFRW
jgi:hypothetical protein